MVWGFRWLVGMAVGFAACGDIRVIGDDAASATTDSTPDAPADGQEVSGDALSSDVAPGCKTDDDCKSIKGKTPCKYPICDTVSGECKLQLRAVSDLCVDPFTDPVACQETRCDGSGQCVAQAQADGTNCGIGACGSVCKLGACTTATAADYDDKNPCTNDYCDQGKVIAHDPVTNLAMTCDDGDACTRNDACLAGVCQGAPLGCSDNIDCTLDTCAKATGCQHTPKLNVCSDANPCTKDACDLAVGCTVVGFDEIAACDDGNACSTPDFCEKGVCKGKPDASACACAADTDCKTKATDLCGVKYTCDTSLAAPPLSGICVPKPDSAVICDTSKDGACLKTGCDTTTGSCATLPVGNSPTCDDGNACTVSSYCAAGACVAGAAADCSDKNPCTVDSCAADIGCLHTTLAGPCDDGNACTVNDACAGGACVGSKKPCDDGLLCTFDSCDGTSGTCQHLADPTACNDQNPCTADTCDLTADCQHAVDDTAVCDDGNVCTSDSCKGGKCVSVVKCDCAVDLDCDDKNPCTTDVCQAGKCVAKNADGASCSPADKCQAPGSGTCGAGACVVGNTPVDCSSAGDACNTGTCDASTGKCQAVAKASGTACDDGNGCTVGDVCAGGKCSGGTPVVCAAKACQTATCVSTGASSHSCSLAAQPIGTGCDDGLFCTVGDQCDASGSCGGTPFACNSSSVCVIAQCSEAQQGCVNVNAGGSVACDDGLFCTVNDVCDGAGGCAGGGPKPCPGGACVTGVCDEPTDQCLTQPTAGCCTVDTDCDDGFSCTQDSCFGGQCSHASAGSCCQPGASAVWSNTFDDGKLEGMALTNSSGSPVLGWQLRSGAVADSPPGALYYGNPAKNNFDFGASQGVASTPPIAIPFTVLGPATLNFNVWFDTEVGNGYDTLKVTGVQLDGSGAGSVSNLWVKPQGVVLGSWQPITVQLPSTMTGQTMRFDFTFDTVDSVDNTGQGVYLDDINVTAQCF